MAKARITRDAIQALREYHNAQAPQRGMFSTLDELLQQAPFEQAPVEQWRGYLKPGRMLKRGDMQFPLKQEELDYSELTRILTAIERGGYRRLDGKRIGELTDDDMVDPLGVVPPEAVPKDDLTELLRRHRPSFMLTVGDDSLVNSSRFLNDDDFAHTVHDRLAELHDPEMPSYENRFDVTETRYGPEEWERLSHESPDSTYQESITRLGELAGVSGHFGPNVVSHSRTSSHATPAGKVRIIEEIQSDLHERAAERYAGPNNEDWMRYATPEELKRHDQIEDVINRGTNFDQMNEFGQQSLIDEQENLVKAAVRRAPRRGYRTREATARYEQFGEPEHLDDLRPDDDFEFISQYEAAVADAPFKSPGDYGRLEMRKQLLSAVNRGEDYLAITRGDDQVARYSQDPERAKGMRYVYDDVYRGELTRLARQYGTEVVDVDVPLKTVGDARPAVMRDATLETTDELEEYLNGGMLSGDMDELLGDTSYIESTLHDVGRLMRETDVPEAERPRVYENMLKVLRRIGVNVEPIEGRGETPGTVYGEFTVTGTLDREGAATFRSGARGVDQNDRDEWRATMNWVANHVRGWMNGPGRARVTQEVKSFPALKITDEVRRRVRQAGVPLWSLGAGAVGLEALRQEADGDGPERARELPAQPAGYAKGGTVKRVLREVFDAKDGAGAVPNNQDIAYRGFEAEMPIWKYLQLAKHLREPRAGSLDYLRKHVKDGGTLGQPRLNVKWMDDEERWQVMDHDGRHRAKVLAEIYGDDATIPVHVIPNGEMRARDIAPYMRGAKFLGEQWKDTAESDPMNIRPMIKSFAKGGMTREQAEMATHYAGPEEPEPAPPRKHRLADRAWASFEEQWSGIDPQGNLRGAIYNDWDAPKDEWVFNSEAQMDLPPQRGVRPGIVNDMMSLPALVDDVGDAFTALDLPFGYDTNFRDVEAIGNAERNMEQTSEAVYDKYDLDAPQGLAENSANAFGMMAAQIPTFGAGAARAPLKGARGMLRKTLSSPLEFFSPLVDPSLGAYAAGTGFGGALGAYGGDVMTAAVRMFDEDPEAAQTAINDLPPDLKVQILEHLLQQHTANRGQ